MAEPVVTVTVTVTATVPRGVGKPAEAIAVTAVIGRAVVDCSCCPWPVHLALVADPDRPVPDGGMPYVLDAEASGMALGLRVHYKQHWDDSDEDDE